MAESVNEPTLTPVLERLPHCTLPKLENLNSSEALDPRVFSYFVDNFSAQRHCKDTVYKSDFFFK